MTSPGMALGPRGHRLWGSAPALRRDPIGTFLAAWREYGDIVRLRLGGPFAGYLVVHPEHVRHVLVDHHKNYRKVPWYNSKLKKVLGAGLLTSEGEQWARQRRLAQPAFHRDRLRTLTAVMTATIAEILPRWDHHARARQVLDVSSEMMRLTLQIVARTMFGADLSVHTSAVGPAVTALLEYVVAKAGAYIDLPAWIPLPLHRNFLAARSTLDAIVYRLIRDRRNDGSGEADLLSTLLSARDEETGDRVNDVQIRDEVMTIFLAGHETTAVALTWTFYLLATHPEVTQRVRAELADVVGGRRPAAADLPHLLYTRMVIEEAMRMFPPAWLLTRQTLHGDEIGGYRIPANAIIYISPYVTHRHPAFWEHPEQFDPERFTEARAASRPRFAYFPFGAGPRHCIGDQFAMLEAHLILASVLQRYHLELVPDQRVELDPKVTLRPRFGMKMMVSHHPEGS